MGDFQLKQVDGPPDPHPLVKRKGNMDVSEAQVPVLAVPDPSIQVLPD